MPGNGLFHKLILRWFLLRQQGLTLSTAELCRDCPEHQEEVERSLQGILAPGGRAAGETGPDQNATAGPLSAPAETAAYTPAAGPSPVSGLLLRWQEQREQGMDLSADELCRSCPEHREEVTGRLRVLRDFYALLGAVNLPGAASPASPMPVVPGYEILETLGEGGMGLVYKARQVKLDRIVALKMIRDGGHARADTLARFRTEAEAIARLQHPSIVQVFEVGEYDGQPFLAMEFCPGGGLDRKLGGTPLSPRAAAALLETLAQAMEAAHRARVVHRDLKPANVLLSADSTPKISDFGLARKLDEAGQTQTGAVMGTPSYMAPEQARGEVTVGPAADVYALGAILYELLTGRPPFRGSTTHNTLQQVLTEDPASPRRQNPKVPRDLEAICLKCLEKEPARRYASAANLAEDLRRFSAGEAIQARPVGSLERLWRWCRRNPAVAASLLVVALALAGGTVVSIAFGLRAEQARRDEADHARSEAAAKLEADQARRDAQRQLIDLSGASGLTAARQGDHSLALLWFARTVQLAKEDPDQEELNRIRFANWRRNVSLPEGSFTVPNFRPSQDRFRTLEFSPDGKYLLSAASTGDCLVWDRLVGRLVPLPGPATRGTAIAWQPGNGLLAVAEKEGPIHILAPPEFRPVEQPVPASGEVGVLAFSRDGHLLAWGGKDGARVWDLKKKEYATPLLPHPNRVTSLSFSAAGDLLATSARDLKARVFRVAAEGREPLFPPVPHTLAEYGISHGGPDRVAPRFAADDQVLLTANHTAVGVSPFVWRSATTGTILASSEVRPTRDFLNAFTVGTDGIIGATVWGRDARLWNARTQQILAAVPTFQSDFPEDVVLAADGKTLVTCGHDTTVRFWSVDDRPGDTLTPSASSILHPAQAVRVSLTSDGQHLAVALWDGTICLWLLPQGLPFAYAVAAGGGTLPALSPDGRFVLPRATSHRSGTQRQTRVYQADTGKPAGPTLDPGGILVDAAFSPDGARVAGACLTAQNPTERQQRVFQPEGKAGNIQLWDWKSGQRVAEPIPMPSEPRGLAFRPGGRSLAVVCADYHVLLLDPEKGSITHQLDPGVRSRPGNANLWWANGEAQFSPDGRFLATWEMSPFVHVWNPDTGKMLHTLPHTERVQHAAFNPVASALLATASRDSAARVWDLTTGKLLVRLQHPRLVVRVRFSPDGTDLISSCDDGMLRVWDWRTGKLKAGLRFHQDLLQDFGFTADRRWLVSLSLNDLQVTDWRTKTPAGPLWNLGPTNQLALAIPAGNRRAVVGGFSGSLVGYDLEKMVTPATASVEDLIQLAELVAGRRILSQGNIVPLTSAEWAERWQRLQKAGFVLP